MAGGSGSVRISLRERLSIDCEKVKNTVVEFIQKKVKEENKAGVCVGLSGGLDSMVLVILAVEALGNENVQAHYLPDRDSEKKFESLAVRVARGLNINLLKKDISNPIKEQGIYGPLIMKLIFWPPLNKLIVWQSNKIIYPLIFRENGFVVTLKRGAAKNSFARFIYKLIAAAIEGGFNARHIQRRKILEEYAEVTNRLLIGAANKSESFVGWFVKDGVDDIYVSPILDLYKTQVRQLARYLGETNEGVKKVIEEILGEAPSPDMWKGIGDEDIIGHSYATIDRVAYVLENNLDKGLLYEEGISPEEVKEIEKIHKLSEWKRANPHEFPTFK